MEREFAANFLEGEDYPRDGDSTELAQARAELAALQNKFENMGFVSGPVTYMEQIGPKRVILSETPSISAPTMPPPVRTLPPPPVEAPVRSNESAAIFELTKTLISLIQESKKEQREHNARLEAMMRNMRPIASARAPTHSYRVKENSAPLLSEDKWDAWWENYIELAFCLLEIEFRWSEAAPFGEGLEHQEDSVEFLIIQAWRTAKQGDLLGFLFGKVEEGNLTLIADELLVFLTQLADDLPLDILSHSDKQPGTHMLSRTLEPHLVWSTCTEIDEDNCLYPSQALYLEIDVTDLTFWDPIARQNIAQDEEIRGADEEEEEEESSSEERDDPDYVPEREAGIADESNLSQVKDEGVESEEEEGSGLSGSECKGFEAEVRDTARERVRERRKRKHQETAEGKRPATDVFFVDPSIRDPWRDPEPPEEEDDGATAEGSRGRRRRRRSESPAPSGSPSRSSLRLYQDLGVRASSPVVLSPTP
ncbi:hypothetical protein CBR_g37487 [Chara braunii]|uniref:Uncharacterized protein n=1 Tax=Chara braunii TaxID=69332 RepID=A0A388LMW7_CHABU|nr:hypothetical protein CBR_g37487 [Chara braunii]|eukprot:GBG83686.1 hypothetical protein CBR_g37487 [Chara braunii]